MIGSREITPKDRKITIIIILVVIILLDIYSLVYFSYPKNLIIIIGSLVVLEFFGLITFFDLFWLLRIMCFKKIDNKHKKSTYESFLLEIYNNGLNKNKILKKVNVFQIKHFNISFFRYNVVILNGIYRGFFLKYKITKTGIYFYGKALKRTKKYFAGIKEKSRLDGFVARFMCKERIIFSNLSASSEAHIIDLMKSHILEKKERINNFLSR